MCKIFVSNRFNRINNIFFSYFLQKQFENIKPALNSLKIGFGGILSSVLWQKSMKQTK